MSSKDTKRPTATFPAQPYAYDATELGESYFRRLNAGAAAIGYTKQDGRYGPTGEEDIAYAQQCFADLETNAAVFNTFDHAQTRALLAGIHQEAQSTLAQLICDAIHRTQPDIGTPCDYTHCWLTDLTSQQRQLYIADETIARLLDETGRVNRASGKFKAKTPLPTEPLHPHSRNHSPGQPRRRRPLHPLRLLRMLARHTTRPVPPRDRRRPP